MRATGKTDVGRVRSENQDTLIMLPSFGVFGVADGIGGRPGGGAASVAVEQCLRKAVDELPRPDAIQSLDGRVRFLIHHLCRVNRWLFDVSTKSLSVAPMTTLTLFCQDPASASGIILHLGDSLAGLSGPNGFRQLNRMHNLEEDADDNDDPTLSRSVLTRWLGMEQVPDFELTPFDISQDDQLLLCTDGVYRELTPQEIHRVINEALDPTQAVDRLVDYSNQAGGRDNISVVLVQPEKFSHAHVRSTDAPGKTLRTYTRPLMHLTISQPGQPTQHLPLADASLRIGELLLHPETGRVRYALPGGAPAVLLPGQTLPWEGRQLALSMPRLHVERPERLFADPRAVTDRLPKALSSSQTQPIRIRPIARRSWRQRFTRRPCS
ncbi:MAG: serine/threonine protein phosphatase PrpC [Kiritimatiellia bacterium]|jgi:serine/threonine protein phosphatase PrpC